MAKKVFVCLVAVFHLHCAAITGSRTERLRVTASPPSAQVRLDDEVLGPAPQSVSVPKRGNASVEVTAPGYRTATCDTSMSASAGYIAADVALCVLLFPLGCLSFIDAAGYWNQLAHDHCSVKLSPEHTVP